MTDQLNVKKGKRSKKNVLIAGGVLLVLLLLFLVLALLNNTPDTAEPLIKAGEEIEKQDQVETSAGNQAEEESNTPDEAKKPDENETNSGLTGAATEKKTFTVEPNPQNFNQDGFSFTYPGAIFGSPALEQKKGSAEIEMGGPYPDYKVITFDSFFLPFRILSPYWLIYPAFEYRSMNEDVGETIELLLTMAADPQKISAAEELPFLPPMNAAQVFHSNVEIVEFNNGKGLRYLTAYYQDYSPVTNEYLMYTFQGITADGRHYVSVSIPVYYLGLPANHEVFYHSYKEDAEELKNNYQGYMAKIARMLDESAQNEFNPPLKVLDEMIKSLHIR